MYIPSILGLMLNFPLVVFGFGFVFLMGGRGGMDEMGKL